MYNSATGVFGITYVCLSWPLVFRDTLFQKTKLYINNSDKHRTVKKKKSKNSLYKKDFYFILKIIYFDET